MEKYAPMPSELGLPVRAQRSLVSGLRSVVAEFIGMPAHFRWVEGSFYPAVSLQVDDLPQVARWLCESAKEVNFRADYGARTISGSELLNFKSMQIANFGAHIEVTDLDAVLQNSPVVVLLLEGRGLKSVSPDGLRRLKELATDTMPTAAQAESMQEVEYFRHSGAIQANSPIIFMRKLRRIDLVSLGSTQRTPNLSSLEDLEILLVKNARKLCGFTSLPVKLKSLVLENCPSLVDMAALAQAKELEYLEIRNIGFGVDLTVLEALPRLEHLYFFEKKALNENRFRSIVASCKFKTWKYQSGY